MNKKECPEMVLSALEDLVVEVEMLQDLVLALGASNESDLFAYMLEGKVSH